MDSAQIPKTPRLVLDTNVVLDCLVFQDLGSRELMLAIELKRIEVLAHGATLDELRRVLAYPQCRLDEASQKEVLDRYVALTNLIELPNGFRRDQLLLPQSFPRCRDPDDEVFLALAYHGRADALVSKDRDLLKLRRKARKFGIAIRTIAEAIDLGTPVSDE